jgi:cell division protein FtsW (lipid II flippase)
MSRGRLRTAVVALGVLLLAAALAGATSRLIAALRLALAGLVLVGAVALERWRYKRLREEAPGGHSIATDERFIDPESGKRVTVFYDPASGERRYVAL